MAGTFAKEHRGPNATRTVLSLFAPVSGGGVTTVFRNLRAACAEFGVDLRWLGCGAEVMQAARQGTSHEDWECGDIVGATLNDERAIATEYARYIVDRKPSAVLFHILCGRIESNLALYLPPEIRRIALVHNITPSTYRAAAAIRDSLHAAIGVSPRIREDLIRFHAFPSDRTFCVPNGVNVDAFARAVRTAAGKGPLRILSCGRIEDMSKGVFWIPEILKHVRSLGVDTILTVAGDGLDLAELKRRIEAAGLSASTEFRGWVSRHGLPDLYASHDVALFPSRFEGLPLAVVEAMAAGCVPIATRIRGVTEFLVQNECTGALFPPGDVAGAARILAELSRDRTQLTEMQSACRASAASRFDSREQARAFCDIVAAVSKAPRSIQKPRSMEQWRIARGLRPAWWTSLPESWKNSLRVLRERIGAV